MSWINLTQELKLNLKTETQAEANKSHRFNVKIKNDNNRKFHNALAFLRIC